MEATFLQATDRLSKRYYLDSNGQLKKESYPNVREFSSHQHTYTSPTEFFVMLKAHAEEGNCLLKGNLSRPIVNESRSGLTDSIAPTRLFIMDWDKVRGFTSYADVITLLPEWMHNTTYIESFSASMGIENQTSYAAHIYQHLTTPASPKELKHLLQYLNLTIPELRSQIKLTATENSLSYPLDLSANDNHRLFFDAAPILDVGVESTLEGERIQYHGQANDFLTLKLDDIPYADLDRMELEKINELRAERKLKPKSNNTSRVVANIPVGKVDSSPTISGVKVERGFVYLNLNGGDSWGYYHPEDNAEVLYNFKSEPNYLIKELLPEYYVEANERIAQIKAYAHPPAAPVQAGVDPGHQPPVGNDPQYYCCINSKTAEMHRITYSPAADIVEILPAPNMYTIKNFQRLHDLEQTAELEEWDIYFDPTDLGRFNPAQRKINTFKATQVLRDAVTYASAEPETKATIPPIVNRVIQSAIAAEEGSEEYNYFLNHCAYIVQTRKKTKIALVMQGVQGTGKGLLHGLMERILGIEYTPKFDIETLVSQPFNTPHFEGILGLFDESNMDAILNKPRSDKLLKEYITEDFLMMRRMRQDAAKMKSNMTYWFFSNENHVVMIAANDRRFTVFTRQEKKLVISDDEYELLRDPATVQAFADFLMTYPVDTNRVHKPLDNAARRFIIELSANSNERVFNALREGNLDFFVENRPVTEDPVLFANKAQGRRLPSYTEALREAYEARDRGQIGRNSLETLIFYTTGNVQPTTYKFSKWLGHHRLSIKPVRRNDEVIRGIEVGQWSINEENAHELEEMIAELEQRDKQREQYET